MEGVVAFTSDIAEPDKDGGALRYRGVDIEELVEGHVTFGNVWALLVDGRFGPGLPPAEPFPLPVHTGDVRVDVQAGLAMLAPIWGYQPLLDIDDDTAHVLPMIEDTEKTGDARTLVKGILDRKEKLMGFGHRVYRAEDPRARVLRATAQRLNAPRYEAAAALEQKRLGKLVRPAAIYTGPAPRTPESVEGWDQIAST
ncbi:citrate/2-methylcitrate synthase [Rhodococcus wratislaviensis]|uniref:citrate/2-methylcitrate synthase n=1 Tax=Rhodococcus wratislaviensis TaxID=44752 RepID=UPI003908BB57